VDNRTQIRTIIKRKEVHSLDMEVVRMKMKRMVDIDYLWTKMISVINGERHRIELGFLEKSME
jgi:hypothetical protein